MWVDGVPELLNAKTNKLLELGAVEAKFSVKLEPLLLPMYSDDELLLAAISLVASVVPCCSPPLTMTLMR